MTKPTGISMDIPDPTKKGDKFLVTVKIVNMTRTPVAKLECHGTYDRKTIDAILNLMGVKLNSRQSRWNIAHRLRFALRPC